MVPNKHPGSFMRICQQGNSASRLNKNVSQAWCCLVLQLLKMMLFRGSGNEEHVYGAFFLTHFIKVVFDLRGFSPLVSPWIQQSQQLYWYFKISLTVSVKIINISHIPVLFYNSFSCENCLVRKEERHLQYPAKSSFWSYSCPQGGFWDFSSDPPIISVRKMPCRAFLYETAFDATTIGLKAMFCLMWS